MPAFEYEALDAGGRARRGVVNADSARLARRELRRLALTPVRIAAPREKRDTLLGGKKEPRLSPNDLVMMTRQLSVLISASTPLEEALNAVSMQTDKPGVRSRILAVRERVVEGWRFADALAEDPKSFPTLYCAVVAAGEASGDLGGVEFKDAIGLGQAMHDDPSSASCVVNRLFDYGRGYKTQPDDYDWLHHLDQEFAESGYRLPALLKSIATSQAFYAVSPPIDQPVETADAAH